MSSIVLPEIKKALADFVKTEEIAEVLSLGVQQSRPVLLYGRGGHGKSDMITACFKQLSETEEEWGVLSLGEGATQELLYGGINFKQLNDADDPRIEYNAKHSFLNKKYFCFEELFDAPGIVLLSLKDTLQRRELRNGDQVVPMQTTLLVAATNKDPSEIAELGDSYAALIERFPLQKKVEWGTYKKEDFEELFDKVLENQGQPWISQKMARMLAQQMDKVHEEGDWVSPRMAVECLKTLKASAALRGATEVGEEDLPMVKYVPGLEKVQEDIESKIEEWKKYHEAEQKLGQLEEKLTELNKRINEEKNPMRLMVVQKSLQEELEPVLTNIRVPESLWNKKKDLQQKVQNAKTRAYEKAMEFTNLPK